MEVTMVRAGVHGVSGVENGWDSGGKCRCR